VTSQRRYFWLTPQGLAAVGLIAAVSYFLLMEHRQHLIAWLPFMILALCPLMHIFMHRGHGFHGHKKSGDTDQLAEDAYHKGFEHRDFEDGKSNADRDRQGLR